jgi:hypothetical protein
MSKSTEELTQAHERLTQAVESIVSGDDWQRMLRTAAKFHRYSFQNQLLISFQNSDATHVAGFNKWKSLGRCVKKGQKGIAIFAPCSYRTKIEDDNGEEKSFQQLRGFRVVHVFDTLSRDLRDWFMGAVVKGGGRSCLRGQLTCGIGRWHA